MGMRSGDLGGNSTENSQIHRTETLSCEFLTYILKTVITLSEQDIYFKKSQNTIHLSWTGRHFAVLTNSVLPGVHNAQ